MTAALADASANGMVCSRNGMVCSRDMYYGLTTIVVFDP
jgi:hypothetical protein